MQFEKNKYPLVWSRFTLNITTQEKIVLPLFKGSVIRSGFGAAFRSTTCANMRETCDNCPIIQDCIYMQIFETPKSIKKDFVFNSQFLPHPFVIEPPLIMRREIDSHEKIKIRLVLIGKAINYVPFFVSAFEKLGKMGLGQNRGKYNLDFIVDEQNRKVYDGDTKIVSGNFFVQNSSNGGYGTADRVGGIQLDFVTPTRVLNNNKPTTNLTFDLLLRNIMRRGSALAEIHCEKSWNVDFRKIIDSSKSIQTKNSSLEWFDWGRYSKRQQREMKLGGFINAIQYEGDITPYIALVRLGEIIHIGKNTTFGMGQYRINWMG